MSYSYTVPLMILVILSYYNKHNIKLLFLTRRFHEVSIFLKKEERKVRVLWMTRIKKNTLKSHSQALLDLGDQYLLRKRHSKKDHRDITAVYRNFFS